MCYAACGIRLTGDLDQSNALRERLTCSVIGYGKSATLLAVIAFSAGCVNFEQQTVSYRHDAARDRLLVHIVYSGIHGDTLDTGLSGAEETDLLEVVQGRQIYLFDSWPPMVDLDALCTELDEPVTSHGSDAARVAEIALRDWWTLLAANVQISNGPFYIDGTGRLSAVQRIVISNLGAVVKSANRAWTLQAEAWLLDAPEWEWVARIAEPFRISGNQLILRYPEGRASPGERRWLDGGILNIVDGIATLTLGSPAAPRVGFVTPAADSYLPNAVEFVRRRFGLAEKFDPKADADAFFAGTRRPLAYGWSGGSRSPGGTKGRLFLGDRRQR